MNRLIILKLCVLLLPACGFAQKEPDAAPAFLKDFPVRVGFVQIPGYMKAGYGYGFGEAPGAGITIISKDDSVRHFTDATVSVVFSVGVGEAMILKNANGDFVTYSNLRKCFFKKGDKVVKGDLIGLLAVQENGRYELEMIISKDAGKTYYYEQTIKYLRLQGLVRSK